MDSSHPAAHGGPELLLDVVDGRVVSTRPLPGRMHRGVEKLFESRDYRAAIALATRHDWLGSVSSEVGLAQLVEAQLGIVAPLRARWVRVLLVEWMRMSHHLLWLAETAAAVGVDRRTRRMRTACTVGEAVQAGLAAREQLLELVRELTGARMHLMMATPGGVRCDPSPDWLRRAVAALPPCVEAAGLLGEILGDARSGAAVGLAVLTAADAVEFSVSGPLARGSGLEWDVRGDKPDSEYGELTHGGAFAVVTEAGCDAAARFRVLAGEVAVSATCVVATAERLIELDGPVSVRLPKVLRVPVGSGYWAVESPTGTSGWFLVSEGGPTPHRLGMRTASFNNAAAMAVTLPGTAMADLPLAVMSHMVVAGDLDA